MMHRKMTLSLANLALGTVLGLVALTVSAKYLGAGPMGQVTTALGFLGLVFFITDLGMGSAHVKRVSEGRHAGDCFATFVAFKLVATTLFVLVSLGALFVYHVVLGKPLESTTVPIFVTVLVYYVAKAFQEVGQSSFDARLETASSQLTTLIDTAVRVVLTIVVALAFGALAHGSGPLLGLVSEQTPILGWIRREPGAALAVATAAGAVLAATTSLILLARTLERGRFRWELLKDYATFALPLFLTYAIGMISGNIDAASLGFFLGEQEAGVFGAVRRVSAVLSGVGTAASVLLFPMISGLAARGDHDTIQASLDKAIRYLSILLAPMVAFALVFGPQLIVIGMSAEFLGGSLALGLLCVYVYLLTLASPHVSLVMGLGNPKVVAKLGIVTALILIVLNLLLVPYDIKALGLRLMGLGVTGAAIATLASGIFWYVSLRILSARSAGYRERARVWKHLLAAGAMVALLYLLHASALPLARWYHLPLYMALGAVVYAAALAAMRELTKADVAYARDALHLGEMLRYVGGELRRRPR